MERAGGSADAREALAGRRLLVALAGEGPPPPPDARVMELVAVPGGFEPIVEPGPEARTWLPVFTSEALARQWFPDAACVWARGAELLALAQRLGCAEVVVDPASPAPERVAAMPEPRRLPRGPVVRALSTPIAVETLERLRGALREIPDVTEAWLVELSRESEDVLLAAFSLPGLSPEAGAALAVRLGERLAPLLPLTLYDGAEMRALNDPDLAAAVAAADVPVYRRAPG